MINVISPGTKKEASDIVINGIRRSCGQTQVQQSSISYLDRIMGKSSHDCWVFIDPIESWADRIIYLVNETPRSKVIIFGSIPESLSQTLDISIAPLTEELQKYNSCSPAPKHGFSESQININYHHTIAGVNSPIDIRPLIHFDFTDEWNNLGYGEIRLDGSIWSLSQQVKVPLKALIADIKVGGCVISAYCGLWEQKSSSLLWFNRSVGPVDSQEWRLVEVFLSNHRHEDLLCWPVVSEIPYGFDAAVTMRLDCDEDIESARGLWKSYQKMNIPFSLALHSSVLEDTHQHALAKEVLADGGAILSHSATHAPNWGGNYDAAFKDAKISAEKIKEITGHSVRYAVSPFHQTPHYARLALSDAGYAGCIGGIIHNDPDFLMARAGLPPGSAPDFIGHSQQVMMHGDCMLAKGEPLMIYKQAFNIAKNGRAFFGYLDHPFSPRYQYGWTSEEQRITMHQKFIDYMKRSGNVLFSNEEDAMDFLSAKSNISIKLMSSRFEIKPSYVHKSKWPLAIEYAGVLHCVDEGGVAL